MLIIQEISQKIHARKNKLTVWHDIIVLFLLVIFILSGITLAPFHADESTFIWISQDYDKIVKQKNIGALRFDPERDKNVSEQRLRLSIGSILGFSIGFARDITGFSDVNNKWDWGKNWEENVLLGSLPDPQLLTLARTCSALMGALGIVFLFLAARQLSQSRLAAWTATLLVATHGDVLLNFRRAMQEGPKFFFLFVTLYISSGILQSLKNSGPRRFLYGLMGLASGLTLAAKQDTAPLLAAIYLALALNPILSKRTLIAILENALYLGGAALIAFASFLAFMPIFWGWWETVLSLSGIAVLLFQFPVWKVSRAARPLALASCALIIGMSVVSPTQWRRFLAPVTSMIEVRDSILDGQIGYRTQNGLPNLDTAQSRLGFLLRSTFVTNVMYMELAKFDIDPINQQIMAYERSYLHGRIDNPVVDASIGILFMVGIWILFKRFNAESLMLYSLLVVTSLFLLASIPLPWQRYYLIMQIPYSLIAGAGMGQAWMWGKQLIERRQ